MIAIISSGYTCERCNKKIKRFSWAKTQVSINHRLIILCSSCTKQWLVRFQKFLTTA